MIANVKLFSATNVSSHESIKVFSTQGRGYFHDAEYDARDTDYANGDLKETGIDL